MKKFLSIAACVAVTSLSAQSLNVVAGWNLLGSNVNNVDISKFGSNIKIVWEFKNGKWYAGSNDSNLNSLIKKYGFGALSKINAGEGFWVYSGKSSSLNLNGDKANVVSLALVKGWNLVSLVSDKSVSVDNFDKPNIASVWKWDAKTSKWSVWSNNDKLKTILNKDIENGKFETFNTINPGEGFWVQNTTGSENINFSTPPKIGFVYEALNQNNAVPVENAKVYKTDGTLIGSTDVSGKIDLSNVSDNTQVIVKKKGLAIAYGTVKNGKLVVLTQKDTLNKVPLSSTEGNQKVAKKGITSQDGSVSMIVGSMKLNQDITVGVIPFMTPAAAPALNPVTVDGTAVPVKQMAIIGGATFSLESSDGKELTPDNVNGTIPFTLTETKMLGDIEDILNGGDTQNYQKFSKSAYDQLNSLIKDGMVDVLVLQYENGKWLYKGKGAIKSYTKKKKVNGKLQSYNKYKLVTGDVALDKLAPIAFVMKMNYLTGEATVCANEGGYKMFDGSIVDKNDSNSAKFSWINNPIPNVTLIGDNEVTSAPTLTNTNGCETISYKVPFLDPNFHVTLQKKGYYNKLVTCSVDVKGATCDNGVMFKVPDTASVEGYVKNKVTEKGIKNALVTLVNPEVLSADKIKSGDVNGTSYVEVGYMPNVTYTWTAQKVDANGTKLYSEVIKTGKGDPKDAKLNEKEIYDSLVKPFNDGKGKFDASLLTGNWQLVVKAVHSFTNTDTKYIEEATGNFDIDLLMPKLASLMSGQLSEKQVETYVDKNGNQETAPKGLKSAAIYGGFSLGFLYEYGAQNDKFEWQTNLLGDASELTDEIGVICNDYNESGVSNCVDDPIANKIDTAYLNIAKGNTLTYSKSLYPVGLNVKYMAKHFKDLLNTDPEDGSLPFLESGFTLRTMFKGEMEVPKKDGNSSTVEHYLASYADISGANSVEDVLDTPSISLAGESVTAYMRKVLTKDNGYYRINMIPPALSGGLEIFAKASGYKFDSNSDIKLVNDLAKGKVSEYDLELEPVKAESIKPKPVTSFNDWNFTDNCVPSVKWQVVTNPLNIEVNNTSWANTVWGEDNVSLLPDKDTDTNGYVWFGDKATGTYSDTGDNTSSQAVCGKAITPVIDLTNNAFPVLKFDSWFEVETVDVAQYEYDQMKVGFIIPKAKNGGKDEVTIYNTNGDAITVNTNQYYTLDMLNPYNEPDVQDAEVPYSSAGDGILPVWKQYTVNAAGLAGYKVKFVFNFESEDDLFNGFRGWGVDNVTVDENQSTSIEMPPMVPTVDTVSGVVSDKKR